MPNPRIPAAGGAMTAESHQSRRAALRLFGAAVATAPALVLAPPAAQAIAGAAIADPALAAVAAFDAANVAFKACSGDDDVGDLLFDELERTVQALGNVAPTTRQGAIHILRRLVDEEMNNVDESSPLHGAIDNLLAFLEGDDAAPPADRRAQS